MALNQPLPQKLPVVPRKTVKVLSEENWGLLTKKAAPSQAPLSKRFISAKLTEDLDASAT